MQQIINFVIRNKIVLLFLLLFGISLAFTIQSHSYHKSKFISSANFFTGGIYKRAHGIGQYFNLKTENEQLLKENVRLKTLLYNSQIVDTTQEFQKDTTFFGGVFRFIPAAVYKNSYSATKNYLMLNKGKRDGVKQDFGVVTSQGIVGIIENTSNKYATVLSILNTKSKINAQLKNSNHIGSLVWNTKSYELVQLTDISKFAPVVVGDTIITGGQSTIFPKGIPIGIIDSFTTDISGDTYTIDVKLFNDMTNIGHVYIIENTDAEEIKTLEQSVDE